MIDYKSFSKDEISFICKLIGEEKLREHLKKCQQDVAHYYRDCRISKLSYAQIENIIFQLRIYPFIWEFINRYFAKWQQSIQEDYTNYLSKGVQSQTAWAYAILDSPFNKQVKLYYKIIDEVADPKYLELLSSLTEIIPLQEFATSNLSKAETDVQQITNLQRQLEDLRRIAEQYPPQIAELEQKIKELRADGERAESELARYHERDAQLLQKKYVIDYLNDGFQHLSLCRVSFNQFGNNQYALHRLADVENGLLVGFEPDSQEPYIYDNHNWLYKMDGPDIQNYYGAWDWYATEHRNDPNRDVVISQFNCNCIPIEIIQASDCNDLESLADALRTGIPADTFCNRMLWCFRTQNQYTGCLIDKKQLLLKGSSLTLASDVYEIPIYRFSRSDVIVLGDKQKPFLRRIDPGAPIAMHKLYEPIDMMRKMLLERANWAVSRVAGVNKSQWQIFRSLLMEMQTEEFIQEFCGKCSCSEADAKHYFDEMLSKADQYIEGRDIPTETLTHLIEESATLTAQCTDLIRTRWEQEHAQELKTAQDVLQQVCSELQDKQKQVEELRAKKDALSTALQQQESLASDVEHRIAERIESAKKDAAAFISDMAFCAPAMPQSNNSSAGSVFLAGEQAETDTSVVIKDIDYLLGYLQDELMLAGVDPKKAYNLGAYLYAAFCSKTPILLAGPNTFQIANALSICLTGETLSTIDCNQEYTSGWAAEMAVHYPDIAAFRNPFRNDWIHPIIEQLESPTRFYVLLHPFAEDLCVEPVGLMNYVLPVLTEPFVIQKSGGGHSAASFSDHFAHYIPHETNERVFGRTIRKLFQQALLRRNIQQVLTDYHILFSDGANDKDMDVMLSLLPAAYIMNQGEALLKELEASAKDTKQSQEYLKALLGMEA